MLISEVCKQCGLTKKAINYYENQGLIKPNVNNNNYRYFDDNDLSLLKQIAILRKLGMGIPEIKVIIESDDKQKALIEYRKKKEFQLELLKVQCDCLNELIDNDLSINDSLDEINQKLDMNMVIKDKLLAAFPGNYGMYLSIHFGKFLNDKIDSNEKMLAYKNIVDFLDNIEDMCFSDELEQYLEEVFKTLNKVKMKNLNDSFIASITDYNSYVKNNRDQIDKYMQYRNSEEFKESPAYKFQQLLQEFYKNSGYYDVFIPNLAVLSDSYREYKQTLIAANEQFLKDYPEAKTMYN